MTGTGYSLLSDGLRVQAEEGNCAVCGTWGRYEQAHRSIREGFPCSKCGASLRYRHQAAVIVDEFGRHGSASFADLVGEPEFAALAIYEPGIIGPFRKYLRGLAGYSSSYYWDKVRPGRKHKGIRCEDLQALTFPDDSFDLAISSDIFEHIREPFRAFEELRRVLKPGGRHIFTVPLTWPLPEETVSRLELDGDGGDRFVLPPVYHSSPVDPQGSLVYTDFGLDLPARLREIGFETRVYYGPRYNLTFASQVTGKNASASAGTATPPRKPPAWRAMLNSLLRRTPRGLPPPPRFLIIGAQKAGTRWLRLNLGEHPDVFAPNFEPNHFNPGKPVDESLDSYRARFEGWNGEPIVGEASPHYMVWGRQYRHFEGPDVPRGGRPALVASMIEEQLPDVKLFAVLRDPCERAYSAFLHHIRQGRVDPNADLLEYLHSHPPGKDPLGLVSVGWYAASLAPYFERFGDRLSVFLNEDISAQPATVYQQALDHIGADRSFTPPDLAKVRFSTQLPEGSKHRLADGRHRGLTAQERAFLLDHFTADIDRLEKMLGRGLSGWRSPG
ncbi:MAG TPA: methyltransferase domain-containing protein [Thermoleophilaceae bacterium]|nr:methyltransferase domain-containing protein [Thermoleophilaceae bacterium]